MRRFIAAAFALLVGSAPAFSQGSGQSMSPAQVSAMLDRAAGSAPYSLMARGATSWQALGNSPSPGQCLISASGSLPSWGPCSTGGVASVSAADSSLTISPNTGSVIAGINLANSNAWGAAQSIAATGAAAFSVGQGLTNPALNIDTSTASSATGLNIKSAAAGGGVALAAISSGTNESFSINAKGSGQIVIGNTSTGPILLSRAISYGGVLLSNAVIGTGSMVLSTSPVLTTPNLGTPSAVVLTSGTGLPIGTGLSGAGTGVLTALGVNVGTAGAFVVNGGALGTPSSGTLTSATGLPIGSGVSGLGTGIATALAVNVGTAGAPVINGGALGTPSSGTLTSATGLPIGTGVSGLGTGIAAILATNQFAAGAVIQKVATGTAALGTGGISSAACATVVTATATGTATTDVVDASFNGDPTAVTGYIPSTSGMLTIFSYPTANTVNFKVCNNTGSTITPGAITLNWAVRR